MTSRLAGSSRALGVIALLALATACGGGSATTTGPGLGAQLAGVAVAGEGVRFAFADGTTVLLRFDSMSCTASGVSCVPAFAPPAGAGAPTCTVSAGTIACTSPGGEVVASADGVYRVHLTSPSGDLVLEGTFDRAARTGSFQVVTTGACSCAASGSFDVSGR